MLKVWPMWDELIWGEAILVCMLSLSFCAKGVSFGTVGMDSSLSGSFLRSNNRRPTLWRAFWVDRLVFFLFMNFLTWSPVVVASLLPRFCRICFLPLCLEVKLFRGAPFMVRGVPFLRLKPFALCLRTPFVLCLRTPFVLVVLPSPKILSITLSPNEARAPIATGIPICLRSGMPLEINAGGIANPPLCMIESLVTFIWFRILSSCPFPISMGSKLNPASAQGKPPRCIIICCLIGSDICFCRSPGPSPNIFPNNPNIPPCWRGKVFKSPPSIVLVQYNEIIFSNNLPLHTSLFV